MSKLINKKVLVLAMGGIMSIMSVPSATTVTAIAVTTVASFSLTTDVYADRATRLENKAERLREKLNRREEKGKENGEGSRSDKIGNRALDAQEKADRLRGNNGDNINEDDTGTSGVEPGRCGVAGANCP